ncbi:MAG TPA: hypothetical protein PKN81_09455 [Anaerolineales bacterium]|nr:hypothetical protein [Anaerolineales bacterium]HUM26446.1 hypothetical protein [Anaerolineales bacterium]
MKTIIPIWINILQAVILAILTFQTYACYFNPQLLYPGITVDENSAKMIYVLGGRNAMMAIISVIALVRQNPRFYSFAFLMHSLRDFQDMFIAPLTGGGIVVFFVFLIVFVTPEILSYLKLNKMANEMEKA